MIRRLFWRTVWLGSHPLWVFGAIGAMAWAQSHVYGRVIPILIAERFGWWAFIAFFVFRIARRHLPLPRPRLRRAPKVKPYVAPRASIIVPPLPASAILTPRQIFEELPPELQQLLAGRRAA